MIVYSVDKKEYRKQEKQVNNKIIINNLKSIYYENKNRALPKNIELRITQTDLNEYNDNTT